MKKYIVKHSVRLDGKLLRVGSVVELESVPSVLAADFELIGTSPQAQETVTIIHENKPALWRVGLFVTGKCNMNCAHCSQAEFRANHGDMELDTAVKVINAVKNSGRKMVFSVTGGEPTLWPHLYEVFKLAKDAGCFTESRLFSNGSDCGQVEKLIADGLLSMYCTNAANCRPVCCELEKKFPSNVFISGGGHFPLIKTAVWNSIPAACNCPGVAVQGNRSSMFRRVQLGGSQFARVPIHRRGKRSDGKRRRGDTVKRSIHRTACRWLIRDLTKMLG